MITDNSRIRRHVVALLAVSHYQVGCGGQIGIIIPCRGWCGTGIGFAGMTVSIATVHDTAATAHARGSMRLCLGNTAKYNGRGGVVKVGTLIDCRMNSVTLAAVNLVGDA